MRRGRGAGLHRQRGLELRHRPAAGRRRVPGRLPRRRHAHRQGVRPRDRAGVLRLRRGRRPPRAAGRLQRVGRLLRAHDARAGAAGGRARGAGAGGRLRPARRVRLRAGVRARAAGRARRAAGAGRAGARAAPRRAARAAHHHRRAPAPLALGERARLPTPDTRHPTPLRPETIYDRTRNETNVDYQ